MILMLKKRIQIIQEHDVVKARISLLQQTTYYESHNELCVLYR